MTLQLTLPRRPFPSFSRRMTVIAAGVLAAGAIGGGAFFVLHGRGNAYTTPQTAPQPGVQRQLQPPATGGTGAAHDQGATTNGPTGCVRDTNPANKRIISVKGRGVTVCPPAKTN